MDFPRRGHLWNGFIPVNHHLNREAFMTKSATQTTTLSAAGPDTKIEIKADEEITLTLRGATVGFFAQVLEEAPLPRKVYLQISEDFTAALQKAKGPK